MTSRHLAVLSLAMLLSACDKSPQNSTPASAPAGATHAPAAAVTAPAPVSAPAATTAPAAASDNGPEVAGSVAVAQGSVADTAKDGTVRQLKDGDDVYPGDLFLVGPDSYLDLDLEDSGRILLHPNTRFQIESYHFDPAAHDPNAPTDANGQPLIKPEQPENAFFRLIKGGLRAVDGLIGHSSPQNYAVETPVATIGVRGTAFDVRYCGDDCGDEADAAGKPENGLYTSVTEGTVDVKNDDGDVVTPAGHSGFVRSRKQRMQALATPPRVLRHMGLPEALKARATRNRSQIQVRRQQRLQRMIERRRQALQKAHAAGRPAAATPPGRRGQRREEKRGTAQRPAHKAARMQQREERRQERKQKRQALPGKGKVGPAGQASTPPERRQQRLEVRQRALMQENKAAHSKPDTVPRAAKGTQKQGDARCKGRLRRGKKQERDKDKCGGG
ncbi:MAG TPA: FecR family protein [Gammaproteobacteria bacterium]|nr:FecR family protein [Gammaproteobacteria bacterium]